MCKKVDMSTFRQTVLCTRNREIGSRWEVWASWYNSVVSLQALGRASLAKLATDTDCGGATKLRPVCNPTSLGLICKVSFIGLQSAAVQWSIQQANSDRRGTCRHGTYSRDSLRICQVAPVGHLANIDNRPAHRLRSPSALVRQLHSQSRTCDVAWIYKP